MDELELANRFDHQRPQLRAVAYRIRGSVNEADDPAVVLRAHRRDGNPGELLGAARVDIGGITA